MNIKPIWHSTTSTEASGSGSDCSIGCPPVDLGAIRPGDRLRHVDHVRCDVDCGHRAAEAYAFGCQPRDHARAACDIENTFTRLQIGCPQQISGYRRGDRGHEVALVVLGCGSSEMSV